MTDPIADMLTRIRNANLVHKGSVVMPTSKMKEAVAKVLKAEGYISDYSIVTATPVNQLVITMRYVGTKPVINSISRVSTPGRRVYSRSKEIKPVLAGMGITIVSTSQGVMTNKAARAAKLGGEIVCKVW